jgi:hypothetical protein
MTVYELARAYLNGRARKASHSYLHTMLQRISDNGSKLVRRNGQWMLMDSLDNRKKWPVIPKDGDERWEE